MGPREHVIVVVVLLVVGAVPRFQAKPFIAGWLGSIIKRQANIKLQFYRRPDQSRVLCSVLFCSVCLEIKLDFAILLVS